MNQADEIKKKLIEFRGSLETTFDNLEKSIALASEAYGMAKFVDDEEVMNSLEKELSDLIKSKFSIPWYIPNFVVDKIAKYTIEKVYLGLKNVVK